MGESHREAGWVKEAVIGPLVVATILASVGLGFGAWSRLGDLGHDLHRANDRTAHIEQELDRLARELYEFRKPGDRFTAQDGRDLKQQVMGNQQCCGALGERVQRLETKFEFHHE